MLKTHLTSSKLLRQAPGKNHICLTYWILVHSIHCNQPIPSLHNAWSIKIAGKLTGKFSLVLMVKVMKRSLLLWYMLGRLGLRFLLDIEPDK